MNMKKTMLFSLLLTVAAFQSVYSQSANSTSGGRYVIICNTAGQFSETHILDSQTGRVWVERGQVTSNPHFVPCTYQLLDGRLSLVPMETEKELALAKNAGTNAAPVSQLQKLKDDVFYADAEAKYWQEQLANIKAGKQWTPLSGWDADGKQKFGAPQEPSEAAAEKIQAAIKNCLDVKDQKQKLIKDLNSKESATK